MNVGELREVLEFIDDGTQIYLPLSIGGVFSRARDARVDFLTDGNNSQTRRLANSEDLVDNEIGLLLIW